jgi:hypothetical protein
VFDRIGYRLQRGQCGLHAAAGRDSPRDLGAGQIRKEFTSARKWLDLARQPNVSLRVKALQPLDPVGLNFDDKGRATGVCAKLISQIE